MNEPKVEKMWAELAPFYDVMYRWKDYRAEAKRIHELIQKNKKSPGHSLLDVACGTGSHTAFLCRDYDVTGIDLNPEMLKVARKKVPEVSFLQADMSAFDLKRSFDVIVCLFSSIAYVKNYRNLKSTISCFSKHLNPGGVLVIEPFLTKETFQTGAIHGGTMEGEGVKISRHNVSRRRGNLAILDFHFLVSTKKGVRYFHDPHELALFDREKFLVILRDAGLRSRFYKNGLMRDRGLYVAVKSS